MSEVEEKLDEIGRYHRNKRFSTHLLHGGLTVSSVLALGILLYYLRDSVKRVWLLLPCKRRKLGISLEETHVSSEAARGCPADPPAATSLPCQRAIVD